MEFEVHRLNVSIDWLSQVDRECFPKFMWLKPKEEAEMRKSAGTAVIVFHKGELIAAGYFVPGAEIKDVLPEFDSEFSISKDEVYIYSVGVLPDYRRQGIGTMLRRELCRQALLEGYVTGSSHVHHKYSWVEKGLSFYKPHEHRRVIDYWEEDDSNPDAEFMRFELNKVL